MAEVFAIEADEVAAAQGVDVGGINKAVGGAASLGRAVLSLVNAIQDGNQNRKDIKDARLAAGLLTRGENRNKLLNAGVVPAYYSASNIRRIVAGDKIPAGWSLPILVEQGFAAEVRTAQWAQRGRETSRTRSENLKRQISTRSAENAQAVLEKKKRTDEAVRIIRGSVA